MPGVRNWLELDAFAATRPFHYTAQPPIAMTMTRLPALLVLLMAIVGCQGEEPSTVRSSDVAESDAPLSSTSPQEEPTNVVFVCQYGYAKSLVASSHFERMAEERGIPVRVTARGITPNESVPEPLVASLSGDGFEVASYRPQALGTDDLADADYVVSFGNDVPESPGASRLDWGEVSALSEDYPKARGEIVAHLSELLDELEASRAQSE